MPRTKSPKKSKRETVLERFEEFTVVRARALSALESLGSPTQDEKGKPLNLSAMIAALPAPEAELPEDVVRALALRNLIFETNYQLLLKLAYRNRGSHLSKEEAIQAGAIGFIRAIEQFDLSRKVTFATYAGIWVRHYAQRASSKSGLNQSYIYLRHMGEMNRHLARTGERMTAAQLGITDAAYLSLSQRRVFISLEDGANGHAAGPSGSPDTTRGFGRKGRTFIPHTSLHEAPSLAEILPCPDETPEGVATEAEHATKVQDALLLLSPKQRAVIDRLFFGDDSLEEAAIALRISRGEVSNLRNSAMAILHETLSDVLGDCEDDSESGQVQ